MRMKVHHWGQAESFYRFRGLTKPSSNSGPSNCLTVATRTPPLCKPFGAHAVRGLRPDRGQEALAGSIAQGALRLLGGQRSPTSGKIEMPR